MTESTSTAIANIYDLDEFKTKIATSLFPSIRLNGKLFEFPDGRCTLGPISVIVLDFHYYNTLYTTAYNPGKIVSPDCWALGSSPVGMIPGSACPVHPTCDDCPKNQWRKDGGKTLPKECRNMVRFAVIDPTGDDKTIYRLVGSPIANGLWQKFVKNLRAKNIHPRSVITDISLDQKRTVPVLEFSLKGPHNLDTSYIAERLSTVMSSKMLEQPPIEA
jgi:hypothetical protein